MRIHQPFRITCITFLLIALPALMLGQLSRFPTGNQDQGVLKNKNSRKDHSSIQKNDPGQGLQATVCLFDTAYQYVEDTINQTWKLNERYKFTWDANNNNTVFLIHNRVANAWVNSNLSSMTYNANNDLTYELYQVWNVGMWENSTERSYSYDGNNNLVLTVDRSWNGSGWDNVNQYIYTYDGNNNQLTGITQKWNISTWENWAGSAYVYDANNNPVIEKYMNWNGASWDTTWKEHHTYNLGNLKVGSLGHYWNGSSWDTSGYTSYTYNVNNLLVRALSLGWTGSAWDTSYQVLYTYDANNNQLSFQSQTYNNGWSDQYLNETTYCGNNCLATTSSHGWFTTPDQKLDSVTTFCSFYIGVEEMLADNKINIAPNPSSGSVTLMSLAIGAIPFTITNILGETVYTGKTTGAKTALNLSFLTPAVYFLNFEKEKAIKILLTR